MRGPIGSANQRVEIRCLVPGEDVGRRRRSGLCVSCGRRQLREAVPPGVIGVRALPLLRVVLKIAGDLRRGVAGESLAHQGRHAGHVGRRLAGAAETHIVLVQGFQRRCPAGRPNYVWLYPSVGRRPAAAVRLDGVNVVPVGRAHGQRAGIGAFRRVADAAILGVMLYGRDMLDHQLNPARQVAAGMPYDDTIAAIERRLVNDPFVGIVTRATRLWVTA